MPGSDMYRRVGGDLPSFAGSAGCGIDQTFPVLGGGGGGQHPQMQTQLKQEGGSKLDGGKPRTDLLDPLALEGISRVLGFGAQKYAAHNWRGGISYSRLIGAALRHIFAIVRGEDIDPESGFPHVDHLGCCWMFLSNMMKTRPDLDDRWKAK
jgi:hypothetical protein